MEIESIAVVGPTASGKTRRAVEIAGMIDGEIISADSRQVYRGMSIGTGKDLVEYGDIPYHLIDICDAGKKYNLHKYLRDFNVAYNDVLSRGKTPVICGGSGMYVENALGGISLPDVPANPELRETLKHKTLEQLTHILRDLKQLHNTTDVDTCARAIRAIEIAEYYNRNPEEAERADRSMAKPLKSLIIGIDIDRASRRERISQRLKSRLDEGMIDEMQNLLDLGISVDDLTYYGLEYKFVTLHVIGQLSYQEMFEKLETAIHQFAKRQMTWFRGMERRGFKINWIPWNLTDSEFLMAVSNLVAKFR